MKNAVGTYQKLTFSNTRLSIWQKNANDKCKISCTNHAAGMTPPNYCESSKLSAHVVASEVLGL